MNSGYFYSQYFDPKDNKFSEPNSYFNITKFVNPSAVSVSPATSSEQAFANGSITKAAATDINLPIVTGTALSQAASAAASYATAAQISFATAQAQAVANPTEENKSIAYWASGKALQEINIANAYANSTVQVLCGPRYTYPMTGSWNQSSFIGKINNTTFIKVFVTGTLAQKPIITGYYIAVDCNPSR